MLDLVFQFPTIGKWNKIHFSPDFLFITLHNVLGPNTPVFLVWNQEALSWSHKISSIQRDRNQKILLASVAQDWKTRMHGSSRCEIIFSLWLAPQSRRSHMPPSSFTMWHRSDGSIICAETIETIPVMVIQWLLRYCNILVPISVMRPQRLDCNALYKAIGEIVSTPRVWVAYGWFWRATRSVAWCVSFLEAGGIVGKSYDPPIPEDRPCNH